MRRTLLTLALLASVLTAFAQTYTNEDEWQAYEDFNNVFLDTQKNIYRDHSERQNAVDRWNGAAAIWCQAIFFDMALNAYRRADKEGDTARKAKYRLLFQRIYAGEKAQYVDFDFDNCNTNTGWFVYDDIMWWTCALARAYETFRTSAYLTYAEKSFCRVWYGSDKVGDDGSYADPARGLGGGMFWEWQPIDKPKAHQNGDFRSACINFPTVIAACTLYNNVPDGRSAPTAARPARQTREWYLEKAKEIYNWATSTLVQNGRVADGIHGGGPEFTDHLYNQATFIGASCMLYQITGETKYKTQAIAGADYVFRNMTSSLYLPLERGVEQGIYGAIFAQYLPMLIYDMGQTRYLTYVKRNIQRAWDTRDTVRGIHDGDFQSRTVVASDAKVESYNASALPALMLMFPVEEGPDAVEEVNAAGAEAPASDVYMLDGRRLYSGRADASPSLRRGVYLYGKKKMLVR